MLLLSQSNSNGHLHNTCAIRHPLIPHQGQSVAGTMCLLPRGPHCQSGASLGEACVPVNIALVSLDAECPKVASLVCAHTSLHCGTVVAACNRFFMILSGQHICPSSLFIARPFAGYHTIGFRPGRCMVLRLLGDTSKKHMGKVAAVEDFNVLYQVALACRSPSSRTSCRSGRSLSLERLPIGGQAHVRVRR